LCHFERQQAWPCRFGATHAVLTDAGTGQPGSGRGKVIIPGGPGIGLVVQIL
jgi:hypothetical protein